MIHILAVAATTAPMMLTVPAAPPPPPAPVIAANARVVMSRPTPDQTLGFAVIIRHDDREIWTGGLAMAANGMATYSQRKSQSVACPGNSEHGRPAQFSTNTELSLQTAYDPTGRPAITVSLRWERPGGGDADMAKFCDGVTTRAVALSGVILPEKGKPVTLTGDAGLTVTLTLQ